MTKKILLIIFLTGLFLVFFTPMELGDVWWHLKTGEWIWENHSLPKEDPFSVNPEGMRGNPVLNSFWLFQLIIYGAYLIGGIYALIIFKAILFAGSFFFVYLTCRKHGLSSTLCFILLVPAVYIALSYDELRPQSATMFFFALTLYLLESRRLDRNYKPFMLLPLIFLLWSNMHGGYVSGIAITLLYASFHVIENIFKKTGVPSGSYFLILALSIVASFLNPNSADSISTTLGMFKGSMSGSAPIHEHLPISEFTSLTGDKNLYFAIIVLAIIGCLSFIPLLRKPDFLHLALFASLGAASFVTYRAGIFFALAGTVSAGKNISVLMRGKPGVSDKFERVSLFILPVIYIVIISFVLIPRSVPYQPAMNMRLLPDKVATYIINEKLPANIYHPYEWGGYFIWRLSPHYKTFIDGRGGGMFGEYSQVIEGRASWREVLDRYGVNTVAYWPILPYQARVPRIVFLLMKDEGWSPVYWDTTSIVFVRAGLAKNPLRKAVVWELITSLMSANAAANPLESRNFVGLGDIYSEMGMKEKALESYLYALRLNPNDKEAAYRLGALR